MEKLLASHGLQSIEQLFKFPKYLQIETVSTCNARCVMCPVDEWKRDYKLMPNTLFRRIVNELAEYADWIERVTPQGAGEPLLDNNLEEKISSLKDIGIRFVEFNSNASLLDADRSRKLLESGLDRITFSIDGATAETFERIRRRLKFDECISNILEFAALRDRLGSPLTIRIRMTIQEDNRHEFDRFLSFWESHLGARDTAYGKHVHNFANWRDYTHFETEKERQRLNAQPCTSPFTSMIVFSDGRVPLCCNDFNSTLQLGDVNQMKLSDIWNDHIVTSVRERHLSQGRQSMDMCIDCNVWDDCAKVTRTERRQEA